MWWKDYWVGDLGFPGGSEGKQSACNVGDPDSIPMSGRSPGEGTGTHFIILAWKIPWTEEPGRLQFMGLQRVRYNWATLVSLSFTLMCSRLITKDH